MLGVYGAAGVPYVAALLATLALVVVLVHRREALRSSWLLAAGAAGVVSLALAAPVITTMLDFYRVASAVVDAAAPAGSALGQLAAPLPLLQAGGIWLDGAYQTPISPSADADTLTHVGLWIVAGLVLLAVFEVVRRRRPEALLVAVPAALTAALVAPGVTPYADAKLLAIMSPSVVMVASTNMAADKSDLSWQFENGLTRSCSLCGCRLLRTMHLKLFRDCLLPFDMRHRTQLFSAEWLDSVQT